MNRERQRSAWRRMLPTLLLAGVLCLLGTPAWAQDDDNADGDGDDQGDRVKVLEPEGDPSKPVVVERKKPKDSKKGDPADSGGVVGPDDVVNFGEDIDIDDNFGDDFDFTSAPANTRFTVDFRDADLSEVVKLMSAQTGRNFIIADSLRAGKKITIISPNPVTRGEAYRAFLSALEMNGLTVVKSGDFYKIIDKNAGLKEPIDPLMPNERTPDNDALVTKIVELEFVDIATIKPVLDQMKSTTGVIVDYPPTNTLIITDTGNAVRRLESIINRLDNDSADDEKIWVYQAQYADASELSGLISQIFQPSGGTQPNNRRQNAQQPNTGAAGAETDVELSQIVHDERTNKLIIVANERSYQRIKQLVLKLDIELPDSGRINVVHLQNSDATEMAQVLGELSTQLQPDDPRRPPNQAQQQAQQGPANAALLQGEVSVVANEATNDLILVASPRDFMAMRSVIKELDRPRKQVFVEAVILEVALDRSRDLGIVLHGGDTIETDDGPIFYGGRTELNDLNSLSAGPLFLGSGSAPGLLAAFIGPSIDFGPLSIPSVALLLNALSTDTDVNVLSTPTILTLDNEEAEISVGERIPFVTSAGGGASLPAGLDGQLGDAAGLLGGLGGLGSTQITRIDVALTLRIKPQINEAGQVRLEIEEEIEEVKPGGADRGGPTTRRRNLKTVVIVDDQQTVVLGGLIRDSENQSVSKVPLLGDIPVIGYLFRSTNTQIQKQNLLLLLTPYVIEDSSDLDKIRERKMEEREAFLEFFGRKDLNYARSVDYDKKHGLLEEIRQTIDAHEAEANAQREAQGVLRIREPEQGIDLPDGIDDGYGEGGGQIAKPIEGQPQQRKAQQKKVQKKN